MARTKSLEKIEREENELLEKLQKEYDLKYGPAVAILIATSDNYLKKITPYKFCDIYSQLPGREKEALFRKVKLYRKDFEFWKECRLNAGQLGIGSLSLMCAGQMVELAADLKQLSEIYNKTLDEDIRETALEKMKKIVKEQPKKV